MVAALVLLYMVVKTGAPPLETEMTFSNFMVAVDKGEGQEVTIAGTDELHGKKKSDPKGFKTTIPANYPEMHNELRKNGVGMTFHTQSSGWGLSVLINVAPFLVLLLLWIFMLRQMQNGKKKSDPKGFKTTIPANY